MSEIQEILTRFWDQLIAQPSGPLAFRFILQPVMAAILAIRDGLKDARTGRPPFSRTIWSDPSQRAAYLREGLKRVSRVIVFAFVMDAIYQVIGLPQVLPGRGAGHRVRARGSSLFVDSRPGRPHRATPFTEARVTSARGSATSGPKGPLFFARMFRPSLWAFRPIAKRTRQVTECARRGRARTDVESTVGCVVGRPRSDHAEQSPWRTTNQAHSLNEVLAFEP